MRKALTAAADPGFRPALLRGVAPSLEHDGVPLPDDIDRVWDVGANRGQFALWARRRWPRAGIDCFEPLEEPLTLLRRVAAPDVRVWPVALGDESGEATMHVTRDDDSSSLHAPTKEQVAMFPGSTPVRTETVDVARLDDFVARLPPYQPTDRILLKIDVQGHELGVLRGAHRTLDDVDHVYVESSLRPLYSGGADTDSVVRFLQERSFSLIGAFNPHVEGDEVLQADLLFRRDDRRGTRP